MPTNEVDTEEYLWVDTEDIKLISDYTQLNFNEVMELDCITYKLLFRDAYIYKLKQEEEGRNYLEDCWILTQTKPDTQKLRNKFER